LKKNVVVTLIGNIGQIRFAIPAAKVLKSGPVWQINLKFRTAIRLSLKKIKELTTRDDPVKNPVVILF